MPKNITTTKNNKAHRILFISMFYYTGGSFPEATQALIKLGD